ncbi:MAG: retroviral-like aspartic protease family protein [Bacteroidales bacterium]|nr:retroviral-like aspartic protease family protein [Candidatus Physcocola equi]
MKYLYLFTVLLMLFSCGGNEEKKNLAFNDDAETTELEFDDEDDTGSETESESGMVSVPFEEAGGVKFVEVKVNGLGVDMILDSGCSTTLISMAEAQYLYDKGRLTHEDFIGTAQSSIADGSIVENMIVNLREVVIGDAIVCKDVEACVSANNDAPLLLGNEVLNRAASYTIDNENKTVNFKIK